MTERALAKVLGYFVFWSSTARQRFRELSLEKLRRIRKFIFYRSFIAVPRSEGDRLIECRLRLFGVHVYTYRRQRSKYRVALLVDEFFGGWDTAIGGYGALARKYVCKYIPNDKIEIDLLLNIHDGIEIKSKLVDQTMLYCLPRDRVDRQKWLEKQAYNLFLSIEMTEASFKILSEYQAETKLLYWIQDPRELKMYQSRLQTVNRLKDDDWSYLKDVSLWMGRMMRSNRVLYISQGESLSAIASALYKIPEGMPIKELNNPVEIDFSYQLEVPPKTNKIIFLGRLEAQKRVWMFCEIARAMPGYEFYVLGATGKGRDEAGNSQALAAYRNADGTSKIPNLFFTGHVDGEVKNNHLRTAKLLLNTSIWEGIPVSWLEALSFGTLIVSAFERDNIVGRFGTFVGEVMGNGTEEADLLKFTTSIEYWMTHDAERKDAALQAIKFVRERHAIPVFIERMRSEILGAI
jgi:glycosyltransferase involved in cell wall biosynthesis